MLQDAWTSLQKADLIPAEQPIRQSMHHTCNVLIKQFKTYQGLLEGVDKAQDIIRIRDNIAYEKKQRDIEANEQAFMKIKCRNSRCRIRGATACKYQMCIRHCPGCHWRRHNHNLGNRAMSIDFILN